MKVAKIIAFMFLVFAFVHLPSMKALAPSMENSPEELSSRKAIMQKFSPEMQKIFTGVPEIQELVYWAGDEGNKEAFDKIKEYYIGKNDIAQFDIKQLDDSTYILFHNHYDSNIHTQVFDFRLIKNNKKIGFVNLRDRSSQDRKKVYLYNIALEDEFINKGFGRLLMEFAIEKMKNLGFEEIYLKAFPVTATGKEITDATLIKKLQPKLVKFYEQFGFKQTGYDFGQEMRLNFHPERRAEEERRLKEFLEGKQ